ncbi:Pr6Pr family membrane protein [Microbacterium paludicola]|uniref:Pr6Pr family membrane protein n=1 Tax=Microbacterium paludicola TaxID=300019 RepID=UPI0016431918|nr:Pr6Pr family membrane protein [Microbacterium paludicola]
MAAETPWGSHLPTVIANFFSYFTILSNLLAVIALVIGGVWMLRTRRSATAEPAWMGTLLACASTYMIVTGIVYNLLLRGISIAGISDAWTNETLHVVIPLVMLADVLLAPRRRALPWCALLVAVTFPIVWAVYTLLRANLITGPATGNPWWYPYPFLDPHLQGGYLGVIGYIVGIAAAIVAVAAGVVWVGRRRGARVYRSTV